ncbi:ATP-grasp fold amidoligase family protein [Gordonibacter massiliensis (ex Traore et al. 2017)]|uniref:Teichuronopeptide biosynthesis TupA-like protein n=1 Tax=Gordonibacter massiliensis (ex Traore et al. 2017) TaxID=1841863 RepID=A0A842JG05_9ACTN|nr:ATP-grasp fold amidoligase family protein [Gordonibacter massiliensis (ex Traore et al. 2017)]MBC2889916.1 hypothetical protein [Gordonibacter massiliensis (ex Traore et al. 2017)]
MTRKIDVSPSPRVGWTIRSSLKGFTDDDGRQMMLGGLKRAFSRYAPRTSQKVKYAYNHGRWPDFRNPREFYEKLSALKLGAYGTDPLIAQCADKAAVREYVEQCGCGHILTELYGTYDHPSEIIYDDMPEAFVVKASIGDGVNYCCPRKSEVTVEQFRADMRALEKRWSVRAQRRTAQERSRRNVFLVEEYLDDGSGDVPPDYKVHCFGGVPKAISLFLGRSDGEPESGAIFSLDWNIIGDIWRSANKVLTIEPEKAPEPPITLREMIHASSLLSAPFPYMRVDLYEIDGCVKFGELTPFPAGCTRGSSCLIDGVPMGDLVDLKYGGRDWTKP